MNQKGFTLAEVLITLGIIGIVAALTIPTLLTSYQNTQYVTALKKAYSMTNQALMQMAADDGCVDDLKCTGLFAEENNIETVGENLVKYFKVAKNCRTEKGQGCFPSHPTNAYYDGTYRGRMSVLDDYDTYYKFITMDGMSFSVSSEFTNCNTPNTSWNLQICGFLVVDVNGLKGPNYFGRDAFQFWILKDTLYPRGGKLSGFEGQEWWNYNNQNNCSDEGSKDGYYCTGRIMEKGWVMDY